MKKRIKTAGALTLAAITVLSAAGLSSVYGALGVETDRECSLTFTLDGTEFDELRSLEIPVDVYKVADITEEAVYDTTNYTAFADLGLENVSSTTTAEEWAQRRKDVIQGGAKIIELRRRSSFQSPAYLSVEMIRSVMGGEAFRFPAGTFVNNEKYNHIMMAMDTTLDTTGCHFQMPKGEAAEMAKLDASYAHLCKMRDELVTLNIVPPIAEWNTINPNL